jgi:hypothetical protein
MGIATVLYTFRLRFFITYAALILGLYLVYQGIDRYAIGEFDTFFLEAAFRNNSTLFCIGWLIGAGFTRWRYWHFFLAAALLCGGILLIAKQHFTTVAQLLQAFLPALIYCFYIIFTAEQIWNYKDKSHNFWWFLLRRTFFFGALVALISTVLVVKMDKQLEAAIVKANGGGADSTAENSVLKRNQNGDFNLKDYATLRSRQGRSNELLFAAHIDNYFPGTDQPNPLYLTAFYYTKFDTSTETFERDSLIPKNDLFEPDPSKIPLYATRTDSAVIRNGMGNKLRRTVEIEVYSKKLDPETYLAPHIGFFVQPIAIEKDFRKEFRSAFRSKGYVSELNSAYFVYNAKDPQIRLFQEQRFEVLRRAKGYDSVDKAFMAYYTQMPGDPKFQRITQLAQKVTANAKTPVDKVLAIRDYFLSKDEDGEPLFSYTDNPGVPDIPSASKLQYFLFENHKGYCAYYAGATLFLLRALGIPSRITVGFMTVDRSDKNKGWYWYYADQAHAWVQVYFPGYGWLDFDTTVGNSEAEQSPTPDGTPPMQPPHAWLAAEGVVVNVDTLKKIMTIRTGRILFHDKEYTTKMKDGSSVLLDVHIATIQRDSMDVDLKDVHPGDSATAVSYAEALKKMEDGKPGESADQILARTPSPVPTDDVYLKKKITKTPEEKTTVVAPVQKVSPWIIVRNIALAVLGLFLLFMALPRLILWYYRLRTKLAKAAPQKAYWTYRAAAFYLNQLGYFREDRTPLSYAQSVIDPAFGTQFAAFMVIYLKHKYAGQSLTAHETAMVQNFLPGFLKTVRSKSSFSFRLGNMLKPLRAISYFGKRP